MKKNYCLDWLLFLSGLACIATGVLLDFHLIPGGKEAKGPFVLVHTYSGYIMAVGILLHLVWHKNWISAVTVTDTAPCHQTATLYCRQSAMPCVIEHVLL